MSMPEPMNPYDSPPPVKQGMSGGAKVLLGVGIGCGVLVLLCCGGLGIGGYFFGRNLQQAISEEPEKIREVTTSIVEIDVPPPLEPKMSLDFSIPFADKKMMTMAIWADGAFGDDKSKEHKPESVLILFQMDGDFANREALKAQFEAQMNQSGRNDWEEVDLESQETIEAEVNGSPAQFTFGKGKRKDGDKEVWQAMGAFDGKGGPAMLFMQLDAEKFTEDQARGVLSSMNSMSSESSEATEKSEATEPSGESTEHPATEAPAK